MLQKLGFFLALLVLPIHLAMAQSYFEPLPEDFQVKDDAASKKETSEGLRVSPDVVDVIVELSPNVYGYLARTHTMKVTFDADPIVQGRATVAYELKVHSHLMLRFPVSFDYYGASVIAQVGVARNWINANDTKIWNVMAGVALKIRVSDWFLRSYIFLEPEVQAGYAQQNKTILGINQTRQAVRLRPSLAVGWERIFDNGFVMNVKIAAEMPYDFQIAQETLFDKPGFAVSPSFGVGYAW